MFVRFILIDNLLQNDDKALFESKLIV